MDFRYASSETVWYGWVVKYQRVKVEITSYWKEERQNLGAGMFRDATYPVDSTPPETSHPTTFEPAISREAVCLPYGKLNLIAVLHPLVEVAKTLRFLPERNRVILLLS
jgi:hypothetical protein